MVRVTRNETKYKELRVTIAGTKVQTSGSAKYLSIDMDRRLRWREQVDAAVAAGAATIITIARLVGSNSDMPHGCIRRLYCLMAPLRVESGLPVWYVPLQSCTTEDSLSRIRGLDHRGDMSTGPSTTTGGENHYA